MTSDVLVPTKNESPAIYYLRQLAILLFSIIFLPIDSIFTVLMLILGWMNITRIERRNFKNEAPRVLVTGVGMSKGLFVARTLYLGGCTVFGADFSKNGNLHCGRFSKAIQRFFRLQNPVTNGVDQYISQVVDIVSIEQIDLWISCSGVATAIEDAKLAKALRERTNCKAFQFNEDIISTLDNKLNFMKKTSELGIGNVKWYPLKIPADIPDVLEKIKKSAQDGDSQRFIIKSASMDDSSRASIPLLSSDNLQEAETVLRTLNYTCENQWIVQEFVESGEEYCTHALVISGRVRAFTACRSESILMHYQQLNPNTILCEKMLEFTQKYASHLGNITGHLSFDFLISNRKINNGYVGSLIPIECNPRCHTATVLFGGKEADLTDRYLETLYGEQSTPILQTDPSSQYGYYWMAHDLIVLCACPIIRTISGLGFSSWAVEIQQILHLFNHLLTWKDPTFATWDVLPWFVLNHLFWPWEIIMCCFEGVKWKQLNVSTGKIFKM